MLAAIATPMDKYRGHNIQYLKGEWVYVDTKQPVSENKDRACGHCGKENTPEGYDGCMGELKGVQNACCGHGQEEQAYVQFSNGETFRKARALAHIKRHAKV